jgi:hypothetical protein
MASVLGVVVGAEAGVEAGAVAGAVLGAAAAALEDAACDTGGGVVDGVSLEQLARRASASAILTG